MQKLFSMAGIVLACCILQCCKTAGGAKSKRLPGVWQATPITADGDNKDWPSPYPKYDEKAMLGYAVSNDLEHLYITVETGDLATQLKILTEGLTVWIDRQGDRSEETAINFPIPIAHSGGTGDATRPGHMHPATGGGTSQQRLELEDRVRAMLPKATEYSLQGFKSCNLQYNITEKDSCGIAVKMAIDGSNELVWEAVIPFSAFYFKPAISRADRGRALSICLETTGSQRPAGTPAQGGGRNGRAMRPGISVGGMGMHMGSGYGGERSNSSAPQNNIMESLYHSSKTYFRFGIAFQ